MAERESINRMIYAIGYQRITVEQLESAMDARKVDLLVDVRSVPYSRKYAFNQKRLKGIFGTRYEWHGKLLGGKVGPAQEEGLTFLISESKSRILMIMCMEHSPCDCHRLYDISRRLLEKGVDVTHLFEGREYSTAEMEEICYGWFKK